MRIRVGFQEEYDDWFELLMVEEEELVKVLELTGWTLERIYWLEGANYTAILTKKN